MAFGVAVTLGVTGIVLLTTEPEPTETGTKLELVPYAGRDRGGAVVNLTF